MSWIGRCCWLVSRVRSRKNSCCETNKTVGNVIPFPKHSPANDREGPIACHERLGGLLKSYERKAA